MTLMVRETIYTERKLTLEEECIYSVSVNPEYEEVYRDAAKKYLDDLGFVALTEHTEYDPNEFLKMASFKKIVDRAATINERRAYYYLKCTDDKNCDEPCNECLFTSNCISYSSLRDKCFKVVGDIKFFEA